MNVGSHVHLIDAAIAAADVNVGVLMLMVADEQIVVHQLQVLQAGRVLQGVIVHSKPLSRLPTRTLQAEDSLSCLQQCAVEIFFRI